MITFIIYLIVDMQNLHGLIWMTSQSPISARRAKNAYPISSRRAKMHILDVIMENYVTEDRPVEQSGNRLGRGSTQEYASNRCISPPETRMWMKLKG